jgi:hypothetical protein
MFAVDHAATALLIKRRFPSVSLTPMLLSVQAMELAWVGFNYLGIERTATAETVRSVADIHLAYMPYSHSVATAVGAALLTWFRGGPGLLALITIGNLANLSIFSPDIAGPEQYLAGRPLLLVTFIFVQVVVTLVLVGILARRNSKAPTDMAR